MIVSNETIAPYYLDTLSHTLDGLSVDQVILPDGESFKTLDTVNRIFDALLKARFERDCTLVALGGGVVGDMTGFAAASYQRGVNFIQAPTTLLAQVDSSVGGKTGINHALGKNMIGAFYQPKAVIADTNMLNTLPDRQLSAGIAEIIKYALIGDTDFLQWLEDTLDVLLARDTTAMTQAIEIACKNKAKVVSADEYESNRRAVLNFGHTYGHAIEAAMGYGQWLHGEAVAAGMCIAARHSAILGWITQADVSRVVDLIARANLPTDKPPDLSIDDMLEHMRSDKKVLHGVVRLILLKRLGQAVIVDNYSSQSLRQAMA